MFWGKKNKEKAFRQNGNQKFYGKDISIIDYLTDGIFVFDEDDRLSLANLKAENFFEVRKKDIIGKTILGLNQIMGLRPLVSFLRTEIKEAIKKNIKIRENFILEVTMIPMIPEEKKIGTLIVLRDITREKFVDRAKSEFVTLAAHQLRTPTSAVKWAIQMLLEGDVGDLNKKQKELIEETYGTNDKAIKLVTDLLNVAQIEEGKYLSNIMLSDVEKVIQSLIDGYKKKMEQKKLNFKFEKPKKQLPKVMIDAEKMEIAVGNIFNNAIKYTPSGGKIIISLKESEKEIEIRIIDTGLGIPQYEQEKLFTKFFRGSNIKKIDTEGTGLGLYISKNIIEAHGGKIWFESEENKGTTFYFTIPVKKEFGEFISGKFY